MFQHGTSLSLQAGHGDPFKSRVGFESCQTADTTHPNTLQSIDFQWAMQENPKRLPYFQKGQKRHFLCIS